MIYAMFANVSVGAPFLAGILPGPSWAFLMMVTVAYLRTAAAGGATSRPSGGASAVR